MPAILETTSDDYQSVVLDKPILFVGRHPDCDLVINKSRKISRKHCCILEIEGKYFVRDLGSTNGVQINQKRISGATELIHGVELAIGDCVFLFKSEQPRKETPAPKEEAKPEYDSAYHFDLKNLEEQPEPVDHELSSDIPILLDDSQDDGFDIGERNYRPERRVHKRTSRSDSDSQIELVAE